jgi:DnaJ-class molecular chaperone
MAPVLPTADYYQVLEIEQHASLDAIVQSYRRLALKLHPDRNKAIDATATFQLVSEEQFQSESTEKRCPHMLIDLVESLEKPTRP